MESSRGLEWTWIEPCARDTCSRYACWIETLARWYPTILPGQVPSNRLWGAPDDWFNCKKNKINYKTSIHRYSLATPIGQFAEYSLETDWANRGQTANHFKTEKHVGFFCENIPSWCRLSYIEPYEMLQLCSVAAQIGDQYGYLVTFRELF